MFTRVEKFVFFGKYHYLADVISPPLSGKGRRVGIYCRFDRTLKKDCLSEETLLFVTNWEKEYERASIK